MPLAQWRLQAGHARAFSGWVVWFRLDPSDPFGRSCRICLLEGSCDDDPLIRPGAHGTDIDWPGPAALSSTVWISEAMPVQGIHWICPPGVFASLGRPPSIEPVLSQVWLCQQRNRHYFIISMKLAAWTAYTMVRHAIRPGQGASEYCRHSRGILLLQVLGSVLKPSQIITVCVAWCVQLSGGAWFDLEAAALWIVQGLGQAELTNVILCHAIFFMRLCLQMRSPRVKCYLTYFEFIFMGENDDSPWSTSGFWCFLGNFQNRMSILVPGCVSRFCLQGPLSELLPFGLYNSGWIMMNYDLTVTSLEWWARGIIDQWPYFSYFQDSLLYGNDI